MRTTILRSWETRRFSVIVTAPADPTGDTVEYGEVADTGVTPVAEPASWTAGSWNGSYVTATEKAESYSPTYGTTDSTPSPDVTLTEGSTYRLYCRVRNASDAPGDLVAVLKVT